MPNVVRVLVLDDDPSDRFLIREALSRANDSFDVYEAGDLSQGIEIAAQNDVHVVLLDLMLGESKGLHTIDRVQQALPETPIVVLSGLSDEEVALRAVEQGAQDYIKKDELESRLTAQCIRHSLQRFDLQQELKQQALCDPVTGLPNRLKFDEELRRSMQNVGERRYAVIFIDLDDFKLVNDTHGHEMGDRLLVDFAGRLTRSVRTSDCVARFGGDEFVVLLSNVRQDDDVRIFVERLESEVAQPFCLDGRDYFISASMGIVLHSDRYLEPGEVLRDADTAMYHAKEEGKGNYRWFCSAMHDRAIAKFGFEGQLRTAVSNNELELYYQPVVDLFSGQVRRVEALLRWNHPHEGLISPLRFIPSAESSGLIVPIGRWVLREACAQLAKWTRKGFSQLGVSVNASPVQLLHHNFVRDVFEAVHDAAIDPGRIDLEVTESCVMKNPPQALKALRELRSAGIRIDVDDFGTGYSSLAQLYQFRYDVLKIDRSFVRSMLDEGDGFIRAIMVLSESLGLQIVAEGVEYRDQMIYLRELGCTLGQGYLFAKPMPADETTEFLRTGCREIDFGGIDVASGREQFDELVRGQRSEIGRINEG